MRHLTPTEKDEDKNMSALLSINNYNAAAGYPIVGSILGFPEPRSQFTIGINGGLSPANAVGSFQVILEGTNDVTGYSNGLPNILGFKQTVSPPGMPYVVDITAPATAQWKTILGPCGNILTTFGTWETKKLATLFNSMTGIAIFPNLGVHFAAVRVQLINVSYPAGSLVMGISVAASGNAVG
jgi:hypothetical protein